VSDRAPTGQLPVDVAVVRVECGHRGIEYGGVAVLTVDLQDGFEGDEVIVRVDGKPVYHEPQVSTLTMIGRATGFTAETSQSPVDVEVDLPKRQLTDRFSVDVTATPHVGISVSGDQLTHRLSSEAFGYM